MGKTLYVLLIAFLTLVATVIGYNPEISLLDTSATQTAITAPLASQSEIIRDQTDWHSLLPSHLSQNIQTKRYSLIMVLNSSLPPQYWLMVALFNNKQQPSWIREVETKGQSLALTRIPTKSRLSTTANQKPSQNNYRLALFVPISFSRYLQQSSPPGLFLLI